MYCVGIWNYNVELLYNMYDCVNKCGFLLLKKIYIEWF